MAVSRRFVLAGVTVAVSLALSLVAAEVAVRALHLAPPLEKEYGNYVVDARVPYKFRPFSVTKGVAEYRHNSAGFRDVEHSLEKPPGVFRILGLGDSFTYGALTSFETSFLARLEAMLNARSGDHPRVEIIKAGISRYYPEPERLLFESYGVAYSPDLVLVGFLPNDVIDTYFGPGAVIVDKSGLLKTREAAGVPDAVTQLYKRVHLLRPIVRRYVAYKISRKYHPKSDDAYRAGGFHEKDWQKIEEEYARMVEIARRLPARLVIVNIPQRGPWLDKHRYPGTRLAAWAQGHGAGFVDALPAMERAAVGPPLYLEEGHCTADGYGVIATAIFEYLTRNGMVP